MLLNDIFHAENLPEVTVTSTDTRVVITIVYANSRVVVRSVARFGV